jgi:hypothetical protein
VSEPVSDTLLSKSVPPLKEQQMKDLKEGIKKLIAEMNTTSRLEKLRDKINSIVYNDLDREDSVLASDPEILVKVFKEINTLANTEQDAKRRTFDSLVKAQSLIDGGRDVTSKSTPVIGEPIPEGEAAAFENKTFSSEQKGSFKDVMPD